jgi:hypothetical protein
MQDIKINNVNQYRHKNAYIVNGNIFLSYNTIIAASYNGVTFITSGYYSNTTAHHKTDAVRYFNNPEVIEVTPETLYKIAAGNQETRKAAISEEKTKQNLIKFLSYNLERRPAAYNGLKIYDLSQLINQDQTGEYTRPYKNGNYKTITEHRTGFKYVSNFNYKITRHYKKQKVRSLPIGTIKSQEHIKHVPTVAAVIYS